MQGSVTMRQVVLVLALAFVSSSTSLSLGTVSAPRGLQLERHQRRGGRSLRLSRATQRAAAVDPTPHWRHGATRRLTRVAFCPCAGLALSVVLRFAPSKQRPAARTRAQSARRAHAQGTARNLSAPTRWAATYRASPSTTYRCTWARAHRRYSSCRCEAAICCCSWLHLRTCAPRSPVRPPALAVPQRSTDVPCRSTLVQATWEFRRLAAGAGLSSPCPLVLALRLSDRNLAAAAACLIRTRGTRPRLRARVQFRFVKYLPTPHALCRALCRLFLSYFLDTIRRRR